MHTHMKKKAMALTLPILLLTLPTIAQTTDPTPYCTADYSDDIFLVEKYIDKVELNGWSNNGAGQYAAPHYVYYNNLTAVDLDQNQFYDLEVDHDGGVSIHGIAAWIDFNQNQQFEDQEKIGEKLFPGNGAPATETFNFTVPATAQTGTTRMRVRIYEDDDYTFSGNNLPVLPCHYDSAGNATQYDWGETEDYDVNIVDPNAGGGTTSIAEATQFDVRIGPNPVSDVLYFNSLNAITVQHLSVFGIDGKEIFSSDINGDKVELSELKDGMYWIRVQLSDGTFMVDKILKIH